MNSLALTMIKTLIKGKLHLGKLNGLERFLLSYIGLPDRIPTSLAATNIEPYLVDPKYNWKVLAEDTEANVELFDKVCALLQVDVVSVPVWMGLMCTGAAELGTVFKIDEQRVPYSVGYPIKAKDDIQRIRLPEEPTGHLKMYFDINSEAQRRHPEMLISLTFDGPWDLAMLLRGDDKLPLDMRLHKDYVETDDPVRKNKIRKQGDPDMYPAIMDLTTQLSIRHIELARRYGLPSTGAALVDQYAASPIMSRQDYVKYVLPYIEKVWLHHTKKLVIVYPCASPMQMKHILEHEPPGIAHQILWANYVFPTTPEGITLPEYDKPAFELAKKYKKTFTYILHGKYLRDTSEREIEETLKRVFTLATDMRTSVTLCISSIPPGASIEKANFAFGLAEKYGRY